MIIRYFISSVAGLIIFAAVASAQWVTVQGEVRWPNGTPVPVAKKLDVTADKDHCLSKGPLFSEEWVINPKNRGVKGVWVWLRPDSTDKSAKLDLAKDVAPPLQKTVPRTFDVDQPCCTFAPRIFANREGDFVNFKNSSPVSHNTRLEAEAPSPTFNQTIAAGQNYKHTSPFKAQRSPVEFSCSMHPWMGGRFMIFDHPYFAVTDDDGKFIIKDCPVGLYRLVYRHESGFHKGKDGILGWPVEIKAGANGTMKVEPLDFEYVSKK